MGGRGCGEGGAEKKRTVKLGEEKKRGREREKRIRRARAQA